MTPNKKQVVVIILGIFSILIVFFAPYGYSIDLGPGPNMLLAFFWDNSEYYRFRILASLEYFPYYLMRIVVLYELLKFFQEKASKKKVIIAGIICELIPLLLTIPGALFLSSDGENYLPIMISIPILLLFVVPSVVLFPLSTKTKEIGY
ncbi:MAG: hypothetical protein ACW96X_10605 [Promethearchaeota archaeon]|jgi:hypothetical protein